MMPATSVIARPQAAATQKNPPALRAIPFDKGVTGLPRRFAPRSDGRGGIVIAAQRRDPAQPRSSNLSRHREASGRGDPVKPGPATCPATWTLNLAP